MWGTSLARQAMSTAEHASQTADRISTAQERFAATLEMHMKTCGDQQARAEASAREWREGLGKRLDSQDHALSGLKTMLITGGLGLVGMLVTALGVMIKVYVLK